MGKERIGGEGIGGRNPFTFSKLQICSTIEIFGRRTHLSSSHFFPFLSNCVKLIMHLQVIYGILEQVAIT